MMYLFEVHWYNEFDEYEHDDISYGMIYAQSYSEAAEKVDKRFPYASSITLIETDDDFYFFKDADEFAAFIDEMEENQCG